MVWGVESEYYWDGVRVGMYLVWGGYGWGIGVESVLCGVICALCRMVTEYIQYCNNFAHWNCAASCQI